MEGPLGEGPLVIGEALAVLANTISAQGEYAKAEPLYRRALAFFRGLSARTTCGQHRS